MNKDILVTYPIIITKVDDLSGEDYLVKLPDFNGFTEGKNLPDAISMARDYIGTTIMDELDDKESVPRSNSRYIKTKTNQIYTLVDVNISQYRRVHDKKPIKKTVSIPSYLNELGEKNKVNFSNMLAEALIQKLC